MPHDAYRAGIIGIATAEAEGEEVSDRIARFARAARLDPASIRHEVTEAADLLD